MGPDHTVLRAHFTTCAERAIQLPVGQEAEEGTRRARRVRGGSDQDLAGVCDRDGLEHSGSDRCQAIRAESRVGKSARRETQDSLVAVAIDDEHSDTALRINVHCRDRGVQAGERKIDDPCGSKGRVCASGLPAHEQRR